MISLMFYLTVESIKIITKICYCNESNILLQIQFLKKQQERKY